MIEPKKNYDGKINVRIGDKEYPLIRTTAKMAFYKDGDKERRVSLTKLNGTKAEENHKKANRKEKIKPVEKLGLWGGHMPDAPESCSHPKKFYDNTSKTNWIDVNICNGCKKSKGCSRWKEYKKQVRIK